MFTACVHEQLHCTDSPPMSSTSMSFTCVCLLQGGAQSPLDCCAEHPERLCGLPPHVERGACHRGGMVGGREVAGRRVAGGGGVADGGGVAGRGGWRAEEG